MVFDYAHRENVERELARILPESITAEWVEKAIGKTRWAQDTDALTHTLSAPVRNFLNRGGKRWRPLLMMLSSEAVGGTAEAVLPYTVIPELIHNGTLIVDDIEDRSELRRGQPTMHKIYGIDVAINAGNTIYFLPSTLIRDAPFPAETKVRAYDIINTQLLKCHIGQAIDISWHGKQTALIPSEQLYLQMCADKSGSLACMAAKLGALLGGGCEKHIDALGVFAETAGVVFQIQDDILNISGHQGIGKDYGDDIREGKKTLMVIHALNNASAEDRERLQEILAAHTSDSKLISEAIGIIERNGSIAYARAVAQQLVHRAWNEVSVILPDLPAKDKLKQIAQALLDRSR